MAGLEDYPIMYSENENTVYDLRTSHFRRIRPSQLDLQSIAPEQPPPEEPSSADEEATAKKYVAVGVSYATLVAENLLSHPLVVLRRQCQVHHNSRRSHLFAVTLVPVVVRLHQRQGVTTLWKGLGSSLLVRGMTLAVEDLLSKVTPWPKEITWHSSVKAFSQHLLLKCVSLAVVTPFYSASLVETVQSDIASEKPGMLDVFREGMCRLVSWGSPQKGRMLPVWALVVPTVIYGIIKYLLGMVVQNVASRVIHLRKKNSQRRTGALQKDVLSQSAIQDVEVTSSFIGMMTADVICYPLETILHRLHLQGTRTIVDNLDSGVGVIPILTSYEGAGDCYENTLAQEGVRGLYKGFGALILQFAAHWAVIKLTRVVVKELTVLLRSAPRPKPPEPESKARPPPSNLPANFRHSPYTPITPHTPHTPYDQLESPVYMGSYAGANPTF